MLRVLRAISSRTGAQPPHPCLEFQPCLRMRRKGQTRAPAPALVLPLTHATAARSGPVGRWSPLPPCPQPQWRVAPGAGFLPATPVDRLLWWVPVRSEVVAGSLPATPVDRLLWWVLVRSEAVAGSLPATPVDRLLWWVPVRSEAVAGSLPATPVDRPLLRMGARGTRGAALILATPVDR
jgi:hypothetical protein